MSHAFDRYAAFTDLPALNAISALPLRKSLRVNTLKTTIEAVRAHAGRRGWVLTPVPWCREAFFIEREDRSQGIGRDLLHQLGHFYLQEAASMLPASLLDPQAGEAILDMSAAPGSKTTQMAAAMQGRGVIVANDVQEKRLWTLKSALHRMGVSNVIVTKKVGQWFSAHMTERFDRVLCDAPCTAQGTVRKDSDALKYASLENIEKMARLQMTLLEAAVHSTKVGGRIVYSTCTLTPEENEGVMQKILNKFSTQLEIVDPRTIGIAPDGFWEPAIADSIRVQDSLVDQSTSNQQPANQQPFLRLWPQTYDTEGFFSAVLRKTAPTRHPMDVERVHFQERELPRSRRDEVGKILEDEFGVAFLSEDDRLFERGGELLLSTKDVASFPLPVSDYSLGLPFGKRLPDGRVLLHNELVTLRGAHAKKQTIDVGETDVTTLFAGENLTCDPSLRGHLIIRHNGIVLGHGLAKDGVLKNNLPRSMIVR